MRFGLAEDRKDTIADEFEHFTALARDGIDEGLGIIVEQGEQFRLRQPIRQPREVA